MRSEIVNIRLQFLNKNGYTRNQPNLNVTNAETNEQNNTRSNTVELTPKETVHTKVEIVDEKKPEVKFDRVSRGAIARLCEKYKVTNTENKGSTTETIKANGTSSDTKDIAIKSSEGAIPITSKDVKEEKSDDNKEIKNTSEEAIPSTSKDLNQQSKKSVDNKEISTISEEKENDETKNVPVPKKRGLFRRSKPNK